MWFEMNTSTQSPDYNLQHERPAYQAQFIISVVNYFNNAGYPSAFVVTPHAQCQMNSVNINIKNNGVHGWSGIQNDNITPKVVATC